MLAECPVNMLKMKEKFSIVYFKSKQLAVHIDAYGRRTGLSRSSITKHLKQVQQVGLEEATKPNKSLNYAIG